MVCFKIEATRLFHATRFSLDHRKGQEKHKHDGKKCHFCWNNTYHM